MSNDKRKYDRRYQTAAELQSILDARGLVIVPREATSNDFDADNEWFWDIDPDDALREAVARLTNTIKLEELL